MVTENEVQTEGLGLGYLFRWHPEVKKGKKDQGKRYRKNNLTGVLNMIAAINALPAQGWPDFHWANAELGERAHSLQIGSNNTCRQMTVCMFELCPYGCNPQASVSSPTSNLRARGVAHTHQHAERDHNSNTHTAK